MEIDLYEHAIHIAFTTYPQRCKPSDYVNKIKELYTEQTRSFKDLTGIEYNEEYLYKPIAYHLFGSFDVALISLIDTFKFAQKVYEPPPGTTPGESINYQIQVGNANKRFNKKSLEDSFKELIKDEKSENHDFPFIMISNLKLNNGLLIGNGANFIEIVQEKLKNLLDTKNFILLNTYNWCELTLILFSNDFTDLGDLIQDIRNITLKDCIDIFEETEQTIKKSKLIESSLYNEFIKEKEKIFNSHCFVDSHSYFGVYSSYIESSQQVNSNLLSTDIEWQIKPGHFNSFISELKRSNIFNEEYFFKAGKIDYLTVENDPDRLSSNTLVYKFLRDNQIDIFKHIRKLKTTVKFKAKTNNDSLIEGVNNFPDILKGFQFTDISKIDANIKALGLSRQIRMKIIKVFHNYNNNIIDPIMYVYIIDFKAFLERLIDEIDLAAKELKEFLDRKTHKLVEVAELEKKFIYFIEAFEDAFLDRVLNNYNYENLHDFNVDFNASSTQVISTYDTLVKMYGNQLDGLYSRKHLLTRINEINTESNEISVNYNIHHLIDPSLVLATMTKEVINKAYNTLVQISNSNFDQIWKEKYLPTTEKYFLPLEKFNVKYFFADSYVYFMNYNGDTSLYWYWTWVYHLQNSTQYNTIGNFNRNKFCENLIRSMYIISKFDPTFLSDISCPILELQSEWEFYFKKIENVVQELIKEDELNNLLDLFLSFTIPETDPIELVKDNCTRISQGSKIIGNNTALYAQQIDIHKKIMDLGISPYTCSRLFYRISEFVYLKPFINSIDSILEDQEFDECRRLLKKFNVVMLDCLYFFREFNSGSDNSQFPIILLKRDWAKGSPIEEFIKTKANFEKDEQGKNKIKYTHTFIDPCGDFFIPSKVQFINKMIKNQKVFYSLWDIGLKYKKQLFKKELSDKMMKYGFEG